MVADGKSGPTRNRSRFWSKGFGLRGLVDVNGGWEGFGGVSLLTIFLMHFYVVL